MTSYSPLAAGALSTPRQDLVICVSLEALVTFEPLSWQDAQAVAARITASAAAAAALPNGPKQPFGRTAERVVSPRAGAYLLARTRPFASFLLDVLRTYAGTLVIITETSLEVADATAKAFGWELPRVPLGRLPTPGYRRGMDALTHATTSVAFERTQRTLIIDRTAESWSPLLRDQIIEAAPTEALCSAFHPLALLEVAHAAGRIATAWNTMPFETIAAAATYVRATLLSGQRVLIPPQSPEGHVVAAHASRLGARMVLQLAQATHVVYVPEAPQQDAASGLSPPPILASGAGEAPPRVKPKPSSNASLVLPLWLDRCSASLAAWPPHFFIPASVADEVNLYCSPVPTHPAAIAPAWDRLTAGAPAGPRRTPAGQSASPTASAPLSRATGAMASSASSAATTATGGLSSTAIGATPSVKPELRIAAAWLMSRQVTRLARANEWTPVSALKKLWEAHGIEIDSVEEGRVFDRPPPSSIELKRHGPRSRSSNTSKPDFQRPTVTAATFCFRFEQPAGSEANLHVVARADALVSRGLTAGHMQARASLADNAHFSREASAQADLPRHKPTAHVATQADAPKPEPAKPATPGADSTRDVINNFFEQQQRMAMHGPGGANGAGLFAMPHHHHQHQHQHQQFSVSLPMMHQHHQHQHHMQNRNLRPHVPVPAPQVATTASSQAQVGSAAEPASDAKRARPDEKPEEDEDMQDDSSRHRKTLEPEAVHAAAAGRLPLQLPGLTPAEKQRLKSGGISQPRCTQLAMCAVQDDPASIDSLIVYAPRAIAQTALTMRNRTIDLDNHTWNCRPYVAPEPSSSAKPAASAPSADATAKPPSKLSRSEMRSSAVDTANGGGGSPAMQGGSPPQGTSSPPPPANEHFPPPPVHPGAYLPPQQQHFGNAPPQFGRVHIPGLPDQQQHQNSSSSSGRQGGGGQK